jgi:DNA repair exonuclease SbcCD ATPase subunit
MSELSHNINVRLTHQMKKKIMDESHRVGMNMSEYILFSLEDYWVIKSQPPATTPNTELLNVQAELERAKSEISQLVSEKINLTERLGSQRNSIWQEATETANRLSYERIAQEKSLAVQTFRGQFVSRLANSDQQLKWHHQRIQQYETNLVKDIFQITQQHPHLAQDIRDLPDVVHFLAYQFNQQFLNQPNHV